MVTDKDKPPPWFDDKVISFNYVKLSLAPLTLKVDIAPDLQAAAGFLFQVKIGGRYETKIGPGLVGTVWNPPFSLGLEALYQPEGAKDVTIDGEVTLGSALAEHAGIQSLFSATAAQLLARGGASSSSSKTARLAGSEIAKVEVENRVGGSTSTGN